MPWTTLCQLEDLRESEGKYVEVDGFKLAVFLDRGQVHVTDNSCPHAGGSMASGWVENGCAVCPWHAWAFDLRSGRLCGSDGFVLKVYPARLKQVDDRRTLVQADLPMP